jgi:hypothetical protein
MRRFAWVLLLVACGVEAPPGDPGSSEAPDVPAVAPPPPKQEATALTGFPCDVRAALQDSCAECHTGRTYAPIISSRADFLQPSHQNDGSTIGTLAATLINSDSAPMMPPAYATKRPTAQQRLLITQWISAGMPAGACGDLTPP